jgi:hypothetical protein
MFASIVRNAPRQLGLAGFLNVGWGTATRGSVSFVGALPRRINLPEAIGASDTELARLGQHRTAAIERHRLVVSSIYSGVRPLL